MNCSTPGFPVLYYLLEFAQIHVHWASYAIQTSHPLSSPSPPAFSISQHQGLFQWLGSSHQVAKELELRFQHQSFQWVVRVDFLWDWLVLFPCCPRNSQMCSPTPQFESINSLVLSLLYGPTLWSKTIALTIWTFVGKVMSQLFNTLSRFDINFLPRSKHLLISWPQSSSAVILEPPQIKSVTVSTVSPSICMKWWDQMPWSLFFECWVLSQLFHSPLSPS